MLRKAANHGRRKVTSQTRDMRRSQEAVAVDPRRQQGTFQGLQPAEQKDKGVVSRRHHCCDPMPTPSKFQRQSGARSAAFCRPFVAFQHSHYQPYMQRGSETSNAAMMIPELTLPRNLARSPEVDGRRALTSS
ncbi:hypothetical protein MRX96_008000 [Rhipicephalus microplus]